MAVTMDQMDDNMELLVRESKQISDFQRKVYLQLLNTTMGETLSYAELAARLGYARPSAACRAIGQALKHNPWPYGWQTKNGHESPICLPLLQQCVPCHRIIRADGSIGGYCGDTTGRKISRKQALINAEKKYTTE